MPIDAIQSANAAVATAAARFNGAPTRAPKQEMDSEVFMKLLVTQLANQDPSSPMDTNQMIGQTTQLATMERLTAMSKQGEESFSLQMRSAAAQLIGRQVEYLDRSGATASGTAASVSFSGSVPVVQIGGTAVALDQITSVRS